MRGVFTGIVASSRLVGFSPTSISGLHLWLDAGTLSLTDGTSVSTWADQSGNGNDATGTALFYNNVVNGKPAIRFNGTGSGFTLPDCLSSLSAASIFCVLIKDIQNDAANWQNWSNGFTSHYAFTDGHIYEGTGQTTRPDCGFPITSLISWHLYEINVGGGNWFLRLNGSTQFSSSGIATTFNSPSPTIGPSGYGALAGYIAEIIVYDSFLGSTDRVNMENYLMTKYGL
jgi:hypothetical protein